MKDGIFKQSGRGPNLLEARERALVGELAAESVGDMEDVHEPPAIVGEVGLLDGEIEVGNDLNGFHKSSMLTRRAVHLNDRRRC